MNRPISRIILCALLLAPAFARAADQSPAEAKLREALKNTMLQLRQAQNDNATLQAQQAEDQDKIKTLTEQNQALTKQSIMDKQAADALISTLKDKQTAQTAVIAKLQAEIVKWEAGYKLATDTVKAKEAERAKLASQVIVLQRKADKLETENIELYNTGTEILNRYQKYSLGDAIMAKEPFTGIMRVRLRNQVQDYQDKLLGQKNAADSGAAASAPADTHTAQSNSKQTTP
jgi:SMC interacting uncharacterized protein involved in chromosome segregation